MTKWILAANNLTLIAVCGVLAIVYLCLMAGCMPRKIWPRDAVEIKLEPSQGHCDQWYEIEKDDRREPLCSERRTLNRHHLICTRRYGHPGAHHMHTFEHCYWIW